MCVCLCLSVLAKNLQSVLNTGIRTLGQMQPNRAKQGQTEQTSAYMERIGQMRRIGDKWSQMGAIGAEHIEKTKSRR